MCRVQSSESFSSGRALRLASRIRFLLLWFILRGHQLVPRRPRRTRFLPPTRAPFPAQAATALKRPSLWTGAFKVAFQKIHSPTTIPGLGLGVRLPSSPPPVLSRSAIGFGTSGSALTRAGFPPCWEGQACQEATSLRPRLSHASFRLRHFRRCPASPLPASASAAWGAVFSASHLLSFRSVLRAQSLCRPGVLLPFLLSGFSDPTGPAEGHVAPGKQPQSAQGAGARKLAAGRRPLLPALPGATESPLSEHDLRGHVVRAQRFRFSEQPGPGAEGAVLEVCVPQVRAAAFAGKRLWSLAVAP